MLKVNGSQPKAVTLKGIDTNHEPDVTELRQSIVTGSLAALSNRSADEHDGLLLGEELASELNLKIGDTVDVVTGEFQTTLYGFMPRARPMTVVGTFKFGFYEIDSSQALMTIAAATNLFSRDGPDMIQLRLANMDDAPAVRDRFREGTGSSGRTSVIGRS